MADSRTVVEKREHVFSLKLTEQEFSDLRQLAQRHFRRPGDELRHLLNEAVAKERA